VKPTLEQEILRIKKNTLLPFPTTLTLLPNPTTLLDYALLYDPHSIPYYLAMLSKDIITVPNNGQADYIYKLSSLTICGLKLYKTYRIIEFSIKIISTRQIIGEVMAITNTYVNFIEIIALQAISADL